MEKPINALKIAREIFETEAKLEELKARLSSLQNSFNAVFHDEVRLEDGAAVATANQNYAEMVRQFFRETPDRVVSIKDIRSNIPTVREETLRAAISRLASANFIHSVDRGKYRYIPKERNFELSEA